MGFGTELPYGGMCFYRIETNIWADMYIIGLRNAKAALPLGLGFLKYKYTPFRFNPNVHVAK